MSVPAGRPAGLPGRVDVGPDAAAVAQLVATWLVARAAAAVAARGTCHVALAGGSTPRAMYDLLAAEHADDVPWTRWHVWFGDERAVPPDDPRSNLRLAQDHLLARVGIPAHHVHRIHAEEPDRAAAAAGYAALLGTHCPPGPGGAPRLDAVILGLGTNGHTASLFPGDAALTVRDRWAAPARADYEPVDRVTLTYPTLNAAAHVAFAVTGEEKGEALRGVIAGTVPAAGVRPLDGELRWFLDEAAARALRGSAPQPGGGTAGGHAGAGGSGDG